MRIQIYVALIAFMLLRILHQTTARAFKASTALLLTQLKISLLRPLDLQGRKIAAWAAKNGSRLSPG